MTIPKNQSQKFYLSKLESGSEYNLVRASLLQKLIRRNMVEEALYVGELFIKDGHHKGLKRRLQVIAAEDIGLGWVNSVIFLEKYSDNLLLVIQSLCEAPKNREADRFLLTVANNRDSVINRGHDILHETKLLLRLFTLSSLWFSNKKIKDHLQNLKNAFSLMAKDHEYSEAIIQLGQNYIDLTKAQIHGARCQMALATLIYSRKWKDQFGYVPKETLEYQSKPFDEIFDFALDMHTPIGKKLKRDFNHWINNCVEVHPLVTYDSLYDDKGKEKYPLLLESNKKTQA